MLNIKSMKKYIELCFNINLSEFKEFKEFQKLDLELYQDSATHNFKKGSNFYEARSNCESLL